MSQLSDVRETLSLAQCLTDRLHHSIVALLLLFFGCGLRDRGYLIAAFAIVFVLRPDWVQILRFVIKNALACGKYILAAVTAHTGAPEGTCQRQFKAREQSPEEKLTMTPEGDAVRNVAKDLDIAALSPSSRAEPTSPSSSTLPPLTRKSCSPHVLPPVFRCSNTRNNLPYTAPILRQTPFVSTNPDLVDAVLQDWAATFPGIDYPEIDQSTPESTGVNRESREPISSTISDKQKSGNEPPQVAPQPKFEVAFEPSVEPLEMMLSPLNISVQRRRTDSIRRIPLTARKFRVHRVVKGCIAKLRSQQLKRSHFDWILFNRLRAMMKRSRRLQSSVDRAFEPERDMEGLEFDTVEEAMIGSDVEVAMEVDGASRFGKLRATIHHSLRRPFKKGPSCKEVVSSTKSTSTQPSQQLAAPVSAPVTAQANISMPQDLPRSLVSTNTAEELREARLGKRAEVRAAPIQDAASSPSPRVPATENGKTPDSALAVPPPASNLPSAPLATDEGGDTSSSSPATTTPASTPPSSLSTSPQASPLPPNTAQTNDGSSDVANPKAETAAPEKQHRKRGCEDSVGTLEKPEAGQRAPGTGPPEVSVTRKVLLARAGKRNACAKGAEAGKAEDSQKPEASATCSSSRSETPPAESSKRVRQQRPGNGESDAEIIPLNDLADKGPTANEIEQQKLEATFDMFDDTEFPEPDLNWPSSEDEPPTVRRRKAGARKAKGKAKVKAKKKEGKEGDQAEVKKEDGSGK